MGKSCYYSSHIEEMVADYILVKRINPKVAVAMIVRDNPEATGLDVIFALVSIAQAVRLWRPKDQFEEYLPEKLYESCALLGADLFALEKLGIHPATCHALTEFWGGDERFFTLPE